jgi:hypothetical protein
MTSETVPSVAARPIVWEGREIRVTHLERKIAAKWMRVWKGYGLSLKDCRARLYLRFA